MKAYTYSVMLSIVVACVLVPMSIHTGVGSTTTLWAGLAEWYALSGLVVGMAWWATEELARLRA